MIHSLQPNLHLLTEAFWSLGGAVMTSFGPTGCLSLRTFFSQPFQLLGANIVALPIEAFAAPLLWSILLLILSFRQHLVSSEPAIIPYVMRSAINQASKRYTKQMTRWRSSHHAPYLQGRRYHHPHHKPCFMAPTIQFCSTLSQYDDKVDHAMDILCSLPHY